MKIHFQSENRLHRQLLHGAMQRLSESFEFELHNNKHYFPIHSHIIIVLFFSASSSAHGVSSLLLMLPLLFLFFVAIILKCELRISECIRHSFVLSSKQTQPFIKYNGYENVSYIHSLSTSLARSLSRRRSVQREFIIKLI